MMKQADKISGFGTPRADSIQTARALVAAGPFDVAQARTASQSNSLSGALITGFLVVYPVLATAAAVMVGISLARPII